MCILAHFFKLHILLTMKYLTAVARAFCYALILLSFYQVNFAQCTYNNALSPFNSDLTPAGAGSSDSYSCAWAGDYFTLNVISGETYEISTCGSAGAVDPILTLYNSTGSTVLASNDNYCGNYAFISYTATFTGTVHILVDEAGCAHGSTCIDIAVTHLSSCTDPDVPSSVTATSSTICTGSSSTLSWTGNLNDATAWHIYTGSCGGTQITTTTSNSISVSPTSTTTYYIRGEDGAGCVDESTGTCGSVTVTVNALDNASFSYSASAYCVNASDPTPTITGLSGGTFSSTAGLSISASTGTIDVSASTPGTYTVTYTTSGSCPNSSNVSVTINSLDDASFSYGASAYCVNAADPAPTITGLSGGTFSSTAGLSINSSTGVIDVSASTPGTYTVTYTTAGACPNSSNVSVTINSLDDASFSYSTSAYCANGIDPTPTITGLAGGNFSSSSGLDISFSTGQIDLSNSVRDTYTVTYTTTGSCPNSSNVTVTITTVDDASFSYGASSYCPSASDPTPTVTGAGGGAFSSTAGLVFISTSTGQIDLSASTPGTYTVTYTTAGTCSNSSNVSVAIEDVTNPAITCPGNQTETPNASCQFTLPDYTGLATASDNCTASPTITQSPVAGTIVTSNTTITLTATDGSGNTANCTFNVILNDVTTPTAVCQNLTVFLDGSGNAAIFASDLDGGSTDNCGTLTFSASQTSFTCADLGANNVTLTVTDGNSNTDNCLSTVTVIDSTSPVAVCQNISVALDGSGVATIAASDIDAGSTDNCSLGGLSVSPAVFGCSDIGANNVTLTVTDGSGNTSTCTAVVTVTEATAPIAVCQNITVPLDGTGNATITASDIDGGSTDNCSGLTLSASQTSFTCADLGANNVTLTVTDGNGNTDNCTAVVTITDPLAPTAVCQNITAFLDGAGNVTITPADLDNGSTDNCGIPTLSLSQSSFTCADIGANSVTLTATDGSSNTDNCVATVTVADTTSPVITCPGNQTETPNASCQFVLPDYTGLVTSSDNCGVVTVTQSPVVGTTISGTTTITMTATDGSGNTSTCNFSVILSDATPPTIACPGNQVGAVDATCMYTVPDYTGLATASDNCGAPTITQSPVAGSTVGQGTTTVTLTANDGVNTSSCSFDLVVSGPTAAFTSTPASACVNEDITFTDASTNAVSWSWDFGDGNTSTSQNPTYAYATSGTMNVTLDVTDAAGCTVSTTTTGAVIIHPPVAAFNANPTNGCTIPHTVFFTDMSTLPDTWSWDFGDGNTSTAQNPIHSYTAYGSFTVTLTTTDTIFGCSDQEQITIDVQDVTPPAITCPGNQNENADASCAVSLPDYTSMTTVSDLCDASPTVTQSPIAGTMVSGLGTVQQVKIYAEDAAGNIDSCSFDVTVVDNTAPIALCQNISGFLDATGNITVLPADIDNGSGDNCSINTMTINGAANVIYTCADAGAQSATLEVFDVTGNSTTCVSTVTVVDTISPIAVCQDITAYIDGSGNVTITPGGVDGGSSDNCAVANLSINQSSFTCADIGANNVTLTVTDVSANTKSCMSTVTVVDTISPVIACPGNQTVSVGATCEFTLPDYSSMVTASDNCNGAPAITQSPAVGTVISATTTIMMTADDGNGNTSTCSFDVVLNDATAPVAVCQDINVYLDGSGNASIVGADVDGGSTDNCTIQSLVVSPNTFTCTNLGANTVTLTVSDATGNQDNCTATVTILDTISPSITCPGAQTGLVDVTCSYVLLDYTSMASVSDNCSGTPTVTQSPVAGTNVSVGTHTVTLTADDGNGNTSSCSFTVTVSDNIVPTITCPGDQSDSFDDNCAFTLPDYTGLATATDNCGSPVVTQSPVAGTVVVSNTTITLTVDDGNGNTANCTFNLTLSDTTRPVVSCPSDETIFLDANCEVILPDYTLSGTIFDNCDGSLLITQNPIAGTLYTEDSMIDVTLTATDNSGNTDSCTFVVSVTADENSGCVSSLVINDLLTPNGDGKNDQWIIHEPSYIIGCQVMVYNRWGQEVFRTENYDNTWEGTYQGQPLPDGAYYYVIICDGEVKYKGDLSILRLQK